LNARRRIHGLKPFLDVAGIGKDRLRLEWIPASEGPKVAETINSFTQTIRELGPISMMRRVISRDREKLQETTAKG